MTSTLSEAEIVLTEKCQKLEESVLACAEAKEKASAARATLAEKEEIQRTRDVSISEQQGLKVALEKAIETDMKSIQDGVGDGNELLELIRKINVDESLMKVLPSTFAKAATERGAFDGMVLSQLETSLNQKLQEKNQ